MGEIFRKELGVAGTNLVEIVEASCVALGVSVKGKSLAQQANECWRILQSPAGAHLPAGRASAGACSGSKHVGGMKTTDPFAVPTAHDDPHERIAERLSRARASAASFASRRSSTRVAPAITESASSASSGLAVDTEAGQVPPRDRAESEGERLSSSRTSTARSAAEEQSSSQSSAAEQSKKTTREAGEPPKQKLSQSWCPPTNRKATAKRFGIALLISLILLALAGALAFAIYVGTCRRAQRVFTSREDLRRAIELYDFDEGFCDSLHGGRIPMNAWDVSAVTDMHSLFSDHEEASEFNQDISAWNVSAVSPT